MASDMKYDEIEENSDLNHDITESLLDNKSPPSSKPHRFGRFMWILIVQNIVFALVLLALWKALVPPSTSLKYQVLTADQKSYPSGPLSWSQKFNPLPCGKTPEEALARG